MPQARAAMFVLDPAFLTTSEPVGNLALCHVRLQSDARYAWLVLIPQVQDVWEIEDLPSASRAGLVEDVVRAGTAVRALGAALGRPVTKLNVGQLGNLTRQLHVHVVGRRTDDAAWPGPVWGQGAAQAYAAGDLAIALAVAREALALAG